MRSTFNRLGFYVSLSKHAFFFRLNTVFPLKIFFMEHVLQSIGTFLAFCLEYYVWSAHGFGTHETYREATTTASMQAAMFKLFVVRR